MALQTPPFAMQNASHSAALFREAATSMLWQSGPLAATDFLVAAQGTPNMSVAVSSGQAWVKGTNVGNVSGQSWSTQGSYYVLNDASVTLTIATANATNPRYDLVYLSVADTFYGGGSNAAALGVVTGTPAPSPSVPGVPGNAVPLASVFVPANATSIVNTDIQTLTSGADVTGGANGTGNYNMANLAGTVIPCQSTALPTNVRVGQMIWVADLGRIAIYTGIGTTPWFYINGGSTNPIALHAYQATAQTGLTSGYTQISFDSSTINLGAMLQADGRAKVPWAGIYLVSATVLATNLSVAQQIGLNLTVNGVSQFAGNTPLIPVKSPTAGDVWSITMPARLLSLNANDLVGLTAACAAGGWNTSSTGAQQSSFNVVQVG